MSVHEDISSRAIAIIVRAGNMTGSGLIRAVRSYMQYRKNKKLNPDISQGKQPVKKLIKQGQGTNTFDVNDSDFKQFDRTMKKYGVDYAVVKNKDTNPPTYTIFFKAKDADTITKAFAEVTAKAMKNVSKPSVINELRKFTEMVKNKISEKVKNKNREKAL